MADRVLVHIGTPKSGTTFVQEGLWHNRLGLLRDGVRYPGHRPDLQTFASLDLLDMDFNAEVDPRVPGTWRQVVADAAAPGRVAVLSNELLCHASAAQAERAVSDLSFAEVHVVCTARDLARQIPSVWQEDVKNRRTYGFDWFVEAVRQRGVGEDAERVYDDFWRYQDYARGLATWGRFLPPDRVHLVPVGADRMQLWRTFAELAGFDADRHRPVQQQANTGLGWEQAEVLRAVNDRIAGRLTWAQYADLVKADLSNRVLAGQSDRTPIRLPAQALPWVRDLAQRMVDSVGAAGYRVHGDLAALVPLDVGTPTEAGRDRLGAGCEAAIDALAEFTVLMADTYYTPRPAARLRAAVLDLAELRPTVRGAVDRYVRAKAAVRERRVRG